MMRGWCPACHPNAQNMGAYKTWAFGQMLQSIGCIIMLLVFVIVPCIVIFVILLSSSCQ